VIGTVNVLECVRKFKFVKQAVIITTDKCYKNNERRRGYKETEELGGHDPYSASKAAAELVIDSYTKAFFIHSRKWVASARSGNVIGGGDYSKERIVPDCIQALRKHRPVRIRHPKATRPWQHVLEPLSGYLLLGTKLLQGQEAFTGAWNFGPEKKSIVPVYQVVDLVIRNWGSGRWVTAPDSGDLHEATLLSLDISKAKTRLKWRPKWDINRAVHETVRWYRAVDKKNAYQLCAEQIAEYMNEG
jgi:CDP-glucose 4,6-dehydratase